MKKLGSSGLGAFPQAAKVKFSDFLRNEEGKVGSRAAFGAASIGFASAAAMLAIPNTAEAATCNWLCQNGYSGSATVGMCGSTCLNLVSNICASHGGVGLTSCVP